MNVFVVKLILLQGSLDTGEQFHIPGAISAPWASFGLEVVSWLLLAIFHAARAAYTVVNWMLLGCAGGGVDTTELLKGGGSWVCRPVAGGRSGSNIHGVSLPGVTTLYCTGSCCLLDGSLESIVRGDFASRCRFAVGFVVVIARVCCFCLGLRSSYGKPSESVVRGEVGGSCPPVK